MKSPEWSRSARNRGPGVSRVAARPAASTELPPRVPEGAERVRAVVLLGSRKKMELGVKARAELEALVGCYPNVAQAGTWKQALQALQR